jgi:integrating conjugative element protein (TIGR03761 family)
MNPIPKPQSGELKNHGSADRHQPERRNDATVQPGELRGTATLVIQTRQAQRLLKGRPARSRQAGIPGLYPFSARMRAIWMAARRNDPDAERYLIQVSKRIEQTRIELDRLRQPLEAGLQNVTGIEVDIARSTSPLRVPLYFGTPYGYKGAYLISDFDQLVCAVLTTRHIGLLAKDDGRLLIARGSRLIRRVSAIPLNWKPLAVIQDDVPQDSPGTQSAPMPMSDPPAPVPARIEPAEATRTQSGRLSNPDDRGTDMDCDSNSFGAGQHPPTKPML